MELKLEVREGVFAEPVASLGGTTVYFTPPIDDEYWLLRVAVSDRQAVVGFPKFTTIGVGFQHEEDWNTNLPWSCDADEIYNHIEHNKADDAIPRERCVQAIRMVQAAAKELLGK